MRPLVKEARMPVTPPPAAAGDARPSGFFARLRARLDTRASSLARELAGLFRGRRIDAELMDELEARLLAADVGVEATGEILQDLGRRVARHELDDAAALLAALRARLAAILAPCQQPLRVQCAERPFVVLVIGVNGSGKTTSIGKLAQRFGAAGLKVALAAGDTFRAVSGPGAPARRSPRSRPAPIRARWSSTRCSRRARVGSTCCWPTLPGGCKTRST
jgi:fused signal recognition particle receptor